LRRIISLWMSYEESYTKVFPFEKMVPGRLDPEMVEDTAKIVYEGVKDKVQIKLIINNRTNFKNSRGYFDPISSLVSSSIDLP